MPNFPAPSAPLRAIAFDMDGLLASSEDVYERVGTETLRRRGKPFEDALRHKMMGLPAPVALRVMIEWHDLPDTVEQIAAESEEIFWGFAKEGLHPMPGVLEFLERVDAAGLPRGVVTSGFRSYAERILKIIGARDGMQFLITADEVKLGKPHPEPYLKAAELHGVAPEEMLVLEDSHNGSRAGVAAGAYTIAVPSPHTVDHDFDGVAFIADTLKDPRIAEALGL